MSSVSDSIVLDSSSNSPSSPDPVDQLSQLQFKIIHNLATALETATSRLARSAIGDPVFTSDADYTHTCAILKSLPTHLDQINSLICDLHDAALEAELDNRSPHPKF